MNSNMEVTHELLMWKKCKTNLRMMTMSDLMIMVMMTMMIMMHNTVFSIPSLEIYSFQKNFL